MNYVLACVCACVCVRVCPVWSESFLCTKFIKFTKAFYMRIVKTFIRQSWCPEWPESSCETQPYYWFSHVAVHIRIYHNKSVPRITVCAGWSEPLLVAHTTLLDISCQESILHYFRPAFSYHWFLSIFEWPRKTGFSVCVSKLIVSFPDHVISS